MLITLLIGVACGFALPHLEEALMKIKSKPPFDQIALDGRETNISIILLVLMGAAIICALIGAPGSAFYLSFGAILGLFGKRLVAFAKEQIDARKTKDVVEDAVEEIEDAAEDVVEEVTDKK